VATNFLIGPREKRHRGKRRLTKVTQQAKKVLASYVIKFLYNLGEERVKKECTDGKANKGCADVKSSERQAKRGE
jgi:hypothetical protein